MGGIIVSLLVVMLPKALLKTDGCVQLPPRSTTEPAQLFGPISGKSSFSF